MRKHEKFESDMDVVLSKMGKEVCFEKPATYSPLLYGGKDEIISDMEWSLNKLLNVL